MYNGALADMRLGVDAYTGNRYAFTGGNPVNRFEVDGHMLCSEPGPGCERNYSEYPLEEEEDLSMPGDDYHFQTSYAEESDGTGFDNSPTPAAKAPSPWENFVGTFLYYGTQPGNPLSNLPLVGDYLGNNLGYSNTSGICAGGDAAFGLGGTVSGCLAVMRTDQGYDVAWVGSGGGEVGYGFAGSLGLMYSNADDWNQVRGSGVGAGISGGAPVGLYGGYGQAVNTTESSCQVGAPITGPVTNSDGVPVGSVEYGITTPGFSVSGSYTCTGVH